MDVSLIATQLKNQFGADLCIVDAVELARWAASPWGMSSGKAAAILLPRSVQDVSEMLKFCIKNQIAIVPQGGNTGLVNGAIPDKSGTQVIINLARMNSIREIDVMNYTVTVDAGCILADVQNLAAKHDRLFAPSFGAEGSCHIGGILSTNAGGHNVLRYGNTRDMVLGLEVVLFDGTIWHGLRKLRKDNTGYDLKQLFIGAEGTLGIITAAVFKLFPKIKSSRTLIAALKNLEDAPKILSHVRQSGFDSLSAFEIISQRMVDLNNQYLEEVDCVPRCGAEWFVLLEFSSSGAQEALNQNVQSLLEEIFAAGLIVDATLASNLAQRTEMWRLRDGVAEAQIKNGLVHYFDVSVAVSDTPGFIKAASLALKNFDPEIDINAFGHAGDGNIHFNILKPAYIDDQVFLARIPKYEQIVYGIVADFSGSFSAEHGIGAAKIDQMKVAKQAVEISLMQQIRSAIADPHLNPGKLVPNA